MRNIITKEYRLQLKINNKWIDSEYATLYDDPSYLINMKNDFNSRKGLAFSYRVIKRIRKIQTEEKVIK